MSSNSRKRGIFALESFEDEAAEGLDINDTQPLIDPTPGQDPNQDPEDIVILDIFGDVQQQEADIIDVSDATDQIDELVESVGDAVVVVGDIENVETIVSDSESVGGLPPVAAELLEASLESLYKRVGFVPMGKVIPALEGFADPATRGRKTNISLEDISSSLKKIIARLQEVIKMLIEKAKQLFNYVFDANVRSAKAVATVKTKIQGSKFEKAGEEVEAPRLANQLSIVKSQERGFSGDLAAYVHTVSFVYKVAASAYEKFGKKFEHLVDSLAASYGKDNGDEAKKFDAEYQAILTTLSVELKRAGAKSNSSLPEGSVAFGQVTYGNKILVAHVAEAGNGTSRNFAWELDEVAGRHESNLSTVTLLSKDEAQAVVGVVEDVNKLIGDYRQVDTTLQAIRNKINIALAKFANSVDKKSNGDEATTEQRLTGAIRDNLIKAITQLDALPRMYSKYALQTNAALLQWVVLSATPASTQVVAQ